MGTKRGLRNVTKQTRFEYYMGGMHNRKYQPSSILLEIMKCKIKNTNKNE